jgi:hypothetical protein
MKIIYIKFARRNPTSDKDMPLAGRRRVAAVSLALFTRMLMFIFGEISSFAPRCNGLSSSVHNTVGVRPYAIT